MKKKKKAINLVEAKPIAMCSYSKNDMMKSVLSFSFHIIVRCHCDKAKQIPIFLTVLWCIISPTFHRTDFNKKQTLDCTINYNNLSMTNRNEFSDKLYFLTNSKWAYVLFELYLLNSFQNAFYVLNLKLIVKLFAVLFRAFYFSLRFFFLFFWLSVCDILFSASKYWYISWASLCKNMKVKKKNLFSFRNHRNNKF